jgi:predicted GTPase
LLVLGARGTGKSSLINQLVSVEENEEVLDFSGWEDCDGVLAMKASTHWLEHRDAHGLEKFEPAKNVEIVELPGYDQSDEVKSLTHRPRKQD